MCSLAYSQAANALANGLRKFSNLIICSAVKRAGWETPVYCLSQCSTVSVISAQIVISNSPRQMLAIEGMADGVVVMVVPSSF
jgi:hypothetical protein